MIKESRISYIPISSQVKSIIPHKVQHTHLNLQDYDTIQLDSWTQVNMMDLFKLTEQKVLPYENQDEEIETMVMVSIEMDLNRVDYSRSRYTVFDLLSDVGGLQGIFYSVFAILMTAWNFNSLDNYMVQHLFKARSETSSDKSDGSKVQKGLKGNRASSEFFPSKSLPYFKDYFLSWVPDRIQCCKLSRREVALNLARDRLEKEMNIIELIKK